MKTAKAEHVERARKQHHDALKAMLPKESSLTGLQAWRKLRRIEAKASAFALQLCNGPEIPRAEQDRIKAKIYHEVQCLFGEVPPGFFINLDPRGYALKLEPTSVPYPLHEDWGRYQILAPEINY